MPAFGGFGSAFHLAVCECGGFHLQVRFSVDIGRVERNMAEPSTDRVDVNAGAKEVGGAGVAPMPLPGLCRVD